MEVIMYTTHCPKCNVLAKKLNQFGINYTEIDDIKTMRELKILSVPVLSVDGALLDYVEAVKWVNSLEG